MSSGPTRLLLNVSMLLILGALSAGCSNRVVADTPRYSQADRSSTFVRKDGLWLIDDVKCDIDALRPVAEWPVCAQWFIVRNGDVIVGRSVAAQDAEASGHEVTVDSSPLLQEISDCPQSSRAASEGEPSGKDPDIREVRYCYNGLAIHAVDQNDRVARYALWPVICGPRTRKDQAVTDIPWDGLKIRGENCLAESEGALLHAARQSRDSQEGIALTSHFRWLRAESD